VERYLQVLQEENEVVTDLEADPRIARTRTVVLAAATKLLSEEGSAGFTVDAVAARSGVAKTTIYRHWPTKDDLLMAALGCYDEDAEVPDTGTVRGDLVAVLTRLAHGLADAEWSRSLPALLDRAEHDPEFAERHLATVRHNSSPGREIVRRAQKSGALRHDIDPDLMVALLAGTFFYRRLMTQETTSAKEVEIIVDAILGGVAR
jgi:AcrR family transcriptional regulator